MGVVNAILDDDTVISSGQAVHRGDPGQEVVLLWNITGPITGTLPTIQFTLQEVDPADESTTNGQSATSAVITSTGVGTLALHLINSSAVLVSWVVGGASPSFGGTSATTIGKTVGNEIAIVASATGPTPVVEGPGTAGTPTGGVLTIQGDPAGEPIPITGSISATNPSVSTNNAAAPASSTQVGGSDGTNLQAVRVFDADTGGGTQYVLGTVLRKSASGGSVEAGTSADPLRVDPTGSTAQPVTDNGGSLTIDGTATANQGTAAVTAGGWPVKVTDGTNVAAVKAASTPAVATDPAIVVAISPNNPILASNPSVGDNGDPVPVASTQVGGSDGTDLQAVRVFDADSGGGTEFVLGTILRKSASGGSVEAGTSTDPLRVDPTGTTTQPVSDGGGSLTVDGTVTANVGTTGGLALDATLTGGTSKAIVRGGAKGATAAADVTSTAEGADHQALDVQIYHGGAAKDPTQIRALTSADVVTSAQGTAAALVGAWPVKVTDGTNTLPTGDAAARAIFEKITDGTNTAAVKAASTAAIATDPALVVAVSPNNTVAVTGTVTATNPSVGSTGAAVPASATQVGGSDGTNLQTPRVFDADTGGGTQYVLGVGLRKSASGGSVEAGTSSDPLRVDPTGTTAQPVTDNGGSLTVDTTQLPAALVGGRLDENVGAWLGSTAPTVGQKTSVNSVPVVIASDQSAVPVSGTVTASGGAKGATPAADVTTTAEGADHQALDVQIYHGGTAKDPTQIRALTATDVVTAAQGTAAALSGFWPVKVTDGTNTLPTGDAVARAIFEKITDGTNTAAVKAASTAAIATDPALVVAVSPNNTVAVTGTVTATNPSVGSTGAAVPASATQIGGSDGTNLQAPRVFDADSGGGTQYVLGTVLRKSASGGSVEAGTSTDPLRVDPTGTTAQPVTDNGGSLTVDTTQLPAALVGGRLDQNVGAWLGSTAPTVGQKTSANSVPVVVASDQSAITVTGTVTNASVGSNNAAIPASSTQVGGSDGTNLQAARVFDADTGGGTQYVLGAVLRKSASGGSVEAGTSTDPLRVDPTGTTAQPVTDNGGSLTIDTTQLPAALVGGRLDENVGAWLGSTAPTVGQKTMANSVPVTLASDQSALSVSPASVGTVGSATPASADQIGASDGTNLRVPRVFDADTGGGTQYVLGAVLRKSASGGSVEAGTSSDPLRVDPTGTTTQPTSGGFFEPTQSTTSVLGSNATYVGAGPFGPGFSKCEGYNTICVSVYSNQVSALQGVAIYWDFDGTGTYGAVVDDQAYSYTFVGDWALYVFHVKAPYYQVQYTNGATIQTAFALSTVLKVSSTDVSVRPGQSVAGTFIGESVRGTLMMGNNNDSATIINTDSAGNIGTTSADVSDSFLFASAADSTVIALAGKSSAGFIKAATAFSGTLLVELSFDSAFTWVSTFFDDPSTGLKESSLVINGATVVARGIVLIGGANYVRVRCSAYTSGSALVTVRATATNQRSQLFEGPSGSAAPLTTVQVGGVDSSSTLRSAHVYDMDSASASEHVVGVSLRTPASGGGTEAGTETHPLRVDPTGDTNQPVSGTALDLQRLLLVEIRDLLLEMLSALKG